MGKKDIRTVDYLSDCVYFADMFNASIFEGKEVVQPEQLEETDKGLLDPETEKGDEVRRDNVKKWKHDANLAVFVIEDQYNIDYHMVIRNLYAEGLYYKNQWKKGKIEHRRKKDLLTGDEFISGMKREEKFIPVVSLVVYFGEERWNGPRTLYELLDLGGDNECLKPFISDYKLNIFDYHDYDNFDIFKTELRVLFEFLRYSKDKEVLRKMVVSHPESYYNVSDETYHMIATLTNSKELLENRVNYESDGGGKNMCKALEDIRLEGREEGIQQGREEGISALITTCHDFGITREEILKKLMEKFALDMEKAEEYIRAYW